MFLEGIIEVAIGIIFVFLVFSFAVMQLVELYATLGKVREKQLKESIIKLMGEKGQKKIYEHRLIKSYFDKDKRDPAYITPETFVETELYSLGQVIIILVVRIRIYPVAIFFHKFRTYGIHITYYSIGHIPEFLKFIHRSITAYYFICINQIAQCYI